MIGKSSVYPNGIGGFRRPWLVALLITDCNKSAARTNSKGERGSPYLTPLLQWKTLPDTPLRRTEEVPELRIAFTQLIRL